MSGVDQLGRVVALTLGPSGRNVILGRVWTLPVVCSDGVTIAKEVELPDPYENMGEQVVKEAAAKTNDVVGDGTTTSVVLARSIIQGGFMNVAAGANPLALKSGIDKAVDAVSEQISAQAVAVESREQVARVAALSAHEEAIAELIADAMDKVGREGIITVEESRGLTDELDVVEGMRLDRGYLSPHFITDPDRMETSLEKPLFLLTDQKLSAAADVVPTLEAVAQSARRPLVIIAEDVEGEALATLVVNKLRGTVSSLAVKAPGFGERRKALLEDLAIMTGGTVITNDAGMRLEDVSLEHLGSARRLVATKDETTIVEGRGSDDQLTDRVSELRVQIEDTTSDYDREKLQERLANLAGGVAVIRVGAATEPELNERKSRTEDALASTRAAVEEGVIPGGGVSLLRAQAMLDGVMHSTSGDEAVGVKLVRDALEAPLNTIAQNAGYKGEVVVENVRNGDGDYGFDADQGITPAWLTGASLIRPR